MAELMAREYKLFEDIRHTTDEGTEFWYARELAAVLDYTQWRNFSRVIDKAMLACKTSGFNVLDHFADASKIVVAGAARKPILDYQLSRYACYLIMQNGDPRKEVIALGQTYFAIQTRKGLAEGEKILDHMGSVELAANLFRITQTEDVMSREHPAGLAAASIIHHTVGKNVRAVIVKNQGTLPEDLPTPDKSITQIEQQQLALLKQDRKKLMLDE